MHINLIYKVELQQAFYCPPSKFNSVLIFHSSSQAQTEAKLSKSMTAFAIPTSQISLNHGRLDIIIT